MAKTGTTALVPELQSEFRALCLAGLKNEELGVKYGFSWVTARKYRMIHAPETMRQAKKKAASEQAARSSAPDPKDAS